jgi:ribonuclease R
MSFDPKDNQEELFPEIESDASDDEEDRPEDEAESEEVVERASKAARKLEPIVLAHVLGPKYQPVKPRVIAKQLKLPSEQYKALKLAIRRLAKAGKLLYGAGHLVRRPQGAKPAEGNPAASKPRDKANALTPALSQGERE